MPGAVRGPPSPPTPTLATAPRAPCPVLGLPSPRSPALGRGPPSPLSPPPPAVRTTGPRRVWEDLAILPPTQA